MPDIKVKDSYWKRDGTFIKTLIEFIQKKCGDETIVKLFNHIRETDYAEAEKLSNKDIFLMYCKLLDEKREPIIEKLRLIEDLVEFSDEYTYQTTNNLFPNYTINYSLLAYCILNKVDWKYIAYIQQHRKINHKAGIKTELEERVWNADNNSIRNKFDSEFVNLYKPYLILGDAYVDFINNRDSWNEKIRATYSQYPDQVTEYLGYMAEHFTYALQAEAETKVNQDWLKSYSKALRNMAEEVISSIKSKRSFEKTNKHNAIYSASKAILDHLDACDDQSLEALDEKVSTKLKDFIKSLRNNINKVTHVEAYSDTQFFTPAKKELTDKGIQTEENFTIPKSNK